MKIQSDVKADSHTVLSVQDVAKEYKLYDSPRDRLKALITGKAYHRSHWALKDISFALHRGQCMGVIGDNGAGKSSLLKLIAGTLQPSKGNVARAGRVTAILELGAGFHPDFSGRDNLYFGGSLIGISPKDMAMLEKSIIEFSELGSAIERPVKTYSSGMVVRLAFALVTAIEPDVLIIDEALAVGDQHFQKKCVERIDAFRKNGCTILFCSHSLYHVRRLCDVALWLDGGQVRAFGETESVLGSYEAHVRTQDRGSAKATIQDSLPAESGLHPDLPPGQIGTTKDIAANARAGIKSVSIAGLGDGEPPLLERKDLVITVMVYVQGAEQPSIGVMLEQTHGVGITSVGTHADGTAPIAVGDGLWRATVTFPDLPLHTGEYVVSAYLFDTQGLVVYEEWLECLHFKFINPKTTPGLVRLPHEWS